MGLKSKQHIFFCLRHFNVGIDKLNNFVLGIYFFFLQIFKKHNILAPIHNGGD